MAETNTPEDRTIERWRRAFLYAYWVFAVLVGVWIAASIGAVHCGIGQETTKPSRVAPRGGPDQVRRARQCHRRLERLLTDLRERSLKLQTRAIRWDLDPAPEWSKWSESWSHRLKLAGVACGFEQRRDNRMQTESVQRLRAAHEALGKLHLSYSELMRHFASQYATGFRQVRAQLMSVKRILARTTASTQTTQQPIFGADL